VRIKQEEKMLELVFVLAVLWTGLAVWAFFKDIWPDIPEWKRVTTVVGMSILLLVCLVRFIAG
jgi:hypothetical protein